MALERGQETPSFLEYALSPVQLCRSMDIEREHKIALVVNQWFDLQDKSFETREALLSRLNERERKEAYGVMWWLKLNYLPKQDFAMGVDDSLYEALLAGLIEIT